MSQALPVLAKKKHPSKDSIQPSGQAAEAAKGTFPSSLSPIESLNVASKIEVENKHWHWMKIRRQKVIKLIFSLF